MRSPPVGALLAALLATAPGCRFARSELQVQVSSDYDYGPGRTLQAVRITVRDATEGPPVFERVVPVAPPPDEAGAPLPLSLTLTPAREASGASLFVEAVACADAECAREPLTSARAITAYVAGERRALRLELSRECEGVRCGAAQTCDPTARTCVAAAVVATQLPRLDADGGAGPAGPRRVAQLAAGGATTCARMTDGTVRCWGGGPGPFDALASPDVEAAEGVAAVSGLIDAVDVSVGEGHACAVRGDGAVLCWGRNGEGQLGLSGPASTAAREVSGVREGVRVAAGAGFSCALLRDATVTCWGRSLAGEPGGASACARSETPRGPGVVAGLGGVVRLAAGGDHACGVDRDGAVWCWGAGGDAALGQNARCDAGRPTRVEGLPPARDVAAGRGHTCALLRDGRVWCWGLSVFGQSSVVARVGASDVQVPTRIADLESVIELRAGRDHTCARRADGATFCWGRNDAAQLGGGAAGARALTRVAGVGPLTALAPGAEHTCARDAQGQLWCWGRDAMGQIGGPRPRAETSPRVLTDRADPTGAPIVARAAAAGALHTCALDEQGVRCWGLTRAGGQPRRDGAGADGDRTTDTSPQQVVGLPAQVSDLALGRGYSCARYDDGAVRCWGNNRQGQLGDGSRLQQPYPVRVRGLVATHGLATGRSHACAIGGDRGVWCWGFNTSGQTGSGGTGDPVAAPARVTGLERASGLALGWFHSCALTLDGAVYCWGENRFGEVGVGDTIPRAMPARVEGIAGARMVRAGPLATCGVVGDSAVYCWGVGTLGMATVPTRVEGTRAGARIVDLAMSLSTQCALYEDGALECWGDNTNGQMLVTNIASTQTPTRASTPVRFASITAGSEFFCGVERGTGEVACWGAGTTGQLGDGAYRSTNARAPAVTRVRGLELPAIAVAARAEHACALLQNRTVRCWGDNASGQLGVGAPTDTSRPVEVTALRAVRDVSAAERHSCAVDGAGGVWCWGANESGQLGAGDAAGSLAPRPVVSAESGAQLGQAVAVSASETHACAVREDGTVWCWGANESGQLGNGSLTPSRSAARALFVDSATAVRTGPSKSCAVLRSGGVVCWGQVWVGIAQVPRSVPQALAGVDRVLDVSLGSGTTCVLRDGAPASRVECWGAASGGLLGPVSVSATATPQRVPGLDATTALAPSYTVAECAVGAEGGVRCWGRVFALFAGLPATTALTMPETVALSEARAVDLAPSFACATRADGTVWCWGSENDQGELGDNSNDGHRDPRPVLGLDRVEQVSVAGRHGCARRAPMPGDPAQGQLWCWGSDATGQLGIGERSAEPEPAVVASVSADSVVSISAGFGHSCALLKNGRVWCWGANASGALGAGDRFDALAARPVVGLVDRAGAPASITGVHAGLGHSCAWGAGQRGVWCWGANGSGQLGGDTAVTLVARRSELAGALVEVSAGGAHTCALTEESRLLCWGGGERGQLGDGARASRAAPARVSGVGEVRSVAAGGAHTCALDAAGAVYCWGANNRGQLGDGSTTDRAAPVRVAGIDDAVGLVVSRDVRCTRALARGACASSGGGCATRVEERCAPSADDFTCAARRDGSVWCWGANDRGQLGDGSTTDRASPVAVRGLGFAAGDVLIAGGRHACVRSAAGALTCWGDDAWGQLGSTGDALHAVPTAVPGVTP